MDRTAELTAAVFGVAGFQLIQAYSQAAPDLRTLRNVNNDEIVKRQIFDTDIVIGGFALLLGIIWLRQTHDWAPLILMMLMFSLVSFYYHGLYYTYQEKGAENG